MGAPERVRIPGSNVFIVDADGNGDFSPPACTGKFQNFQLDYYESGSNPVCPSDFTVVGALGEIGFPQLWAVRMSGVRNVFQLCHQLLHDTQVKSREKFAIALADLKEELTLSPVFPLMKALQIDPEETVRSAAASALIKLGDRSAVPALVKAIREDQSSFVRRNIISSLDEKWRHPAIVSALGEALQNKKRSSDEHNVRVAAADALKEIGDPSAAESLARAIENPHTCTVSAFFALAKLAGKLAVPTLDRFIQSDALVMAREQAVEALGKIEDEATVPPLIGAFEFEESNMYIVREAAAKILARRWLSQSPVISSFVKGIKKENPPALLYIILRALEGVTNERPTEPIIAALETKLAHYEVEIARERDLLHFNKSERPMDYVRGLEGRCREIRRVLEKLKRLPSLRKVLPLHPSPEPGLAIDTLPKIEPKIKTKITDGTFPFMGFATSDSKISSEILSRFTGAFFAEAQKRRLKIIIPNIPEIVETRKITTPCMDQKCTAEICGAMGKDSGFYGRIDWMEDSNKYKITLYYVIQQDQSIRHQVSLFVTQEEIQSSFRRLASELATSMLKEFSFDELERQ